MKKMIYGKEEHKDLDSKKKDTDEQVIQYPKDKNLVNLWQEEMYPQTSPHKSTYFNVGPSEEYMVVQNENYPGGAKASDHVELNEMQNRLSEFIKVNLGGANESPLGKEYTHTNSYTSLLHQPTYDGVQPFGTSRIELPSGNRTNVYTKNMKLNEPLAYDADINFLTNNI